MKIKMCCITSIVLGLPTSASLAQWYSEPFPGSDFEGPAFYFEEIAEDIYQARGEGNLLVGSNAAVVVNETDVLVIDSSISPAGAAALARELRSITDKPIRYVINTHFHFDHAHGNQVYPADVQIIGHEFTYEMLAAGESIGRTYDRFQDWISSVPGGDEGQQGLIPTPPNMTFADRMTVFRGNREIQLLFVGRGHTGGDVVVYLPREKILFTGDLLLEEIPYMGDAYLNDWVDTLEALSQLDFDIVVPGHGRPFTDRARIDHLQNLISDLWQKTNQACEQGMSAPMAAEQIDVSNNSDAYPALAGPGVPIETVERIYELIACER